MAGARPTTLSGRGTVGRSGTMTLFVSTGIPDDATVRKLGLDPNAIFRKAAGP